MDEAGRIPGRWLGGHSRTLGHHGVLFLDELTEFRRDAVEALRQSARGRPRGRYADGRSVYELDAEPSAEDAAILQWLMNAGHADLVKFLG